MTDTQTKLYQGQPATTDTLLYGGSATGATILSIHCANTTSAVATITIGVNATGTLGVTNEILTLYPIPAYGTYDYVGMIQLDASATTGTIRALQGTSGAITVIISGNVIT
jgi:hypothetical protein